MTVFDITAELAGAPVPPDEPETRLTRVMSMADGDRCNLTRLEMSLHSGTHLEAPFHYLNNGRTISEMPLTSFVGECAVIPCGGLTNDLTGADIEKMVRPGVKKVLFKTLGGCRLSRSAAFALIHAGVELVGIDSPSIAPEDDEETVHRELMMAGVALLEGLTLRHVQSGTYTLVALPLRIDGVEAAPCRAILLKQD